MRSRVFRAVRVVAVVAVGIVLLLLVWVQVDQLVLRWRAKRLLADMQAITLHESTWADAQRMMTRWGAWGHYDGTCTSESCRYEINLEDGVGDALRRIPENVMNHLPNPLLSRLFACVGFRGGSFSTAFTVQDGRIVGKSVSLMVQVPARTLRPNDYGYAVIANVVSVEHVLDWYTLNRRQRQFAADPFYTAHRPGGCTNCMMADLSYSDRAPLTEVQRLESVQVDCLSAWTGCSTVEDLLPASGPFHLYDGTSGEPPAQPKRVETGPAAPCEIPVWALGRDASTILILDVLRSRPVPNEYDEASPEQEAEVHVADALKGSAEPYRQGTLKLRPHPYLEEDPSAAGEQFEVGKRYLVLNYAEIGDEFAMGSREISLDRCEVLPDTPVNRTELLRGAALNDHLRQPEIHRWLIP